MIKLVNKTIFITGSSGGIGTALVDVFAERGVKKIYVTDLKMEKLLPLQAKYPGIVVPLELDVTNLTSVRTCHAHCEDTEILINNAGVEFATRFIGEKSLDAARLEMAVNYQGTHYLSHVFWPSLLQKPSSSIVNMLSVASFTHIPQLATYCASKAAAHVLTRSLRRESIGTSLIVHGVYPGYVDTQMTQNIRDVEKVTPEQIAIETCNGLEQGVLDIFPDSMARQFAWKIEGSEPTHAATTPLMRQSLLGVADGGAPESTESREFGLS